MPPVVGIRSIRQVKALNGSLKSRKLSCYSCDNCINNVEPCENEAITGPYKSIYFNGTMGDSEDLNFEYIQQETTLLAPGMVIAVMADDPVTDYYVMEVRKCPFKLRKDLKDAWGADFKSGTTVLSGVYYDQINNNPLNLKKIPGKMAMVHECAYVYTCGEIDSDTIINISEEVHLNILARLQEITGDLS